MSSERDMNIYVDYPGYFISHTLFVLFKWLIPTWFRRWRSFSPVSFRLDRSALKTIIIYYYADSVNI